MFTGALIGAVPVLLVFLFLQRLPRGSRPPVCAEALPGRVLGWTP